MILLERTATAERKLKCIKSNVNFTLVQEPNLVMGLALQSQNPP